ncbi:MAG: hypothetical protein JO161_09540, partial [Planctomycetaceae bacterium]|nr:hypothetical protein [Planctomycetaceae bacterium]
MVLSTCNRVEIYLAGRAEAVPDADAVCDFLADFHAIPSDL